MGDPYGNDNNNNNDDDDLWGLSGGSVSLDTSESCDAEVDMQPLHIFFAVHSYLGEEERESARYGRDGVKNQRTGSLFGLATKERKLYEKIFFLFLVPKKHRKYWFDNRRLQLLSDLDLITETTSANQHSDLDDSTPSPASPRSEFLSLCHSFFAKLTGFFVVEECVLRAGSGIVTMT